MRLVFNWLNRDLLFVFVGIAVVGAGSLVVTSVRAKTAVIHREYHQDGTLSIEGPVDSAGKYHGLVREWFDTGVLRWESTWTHGECTSRRGYWPSGRLQFVEKEGAGYQRERTEFPDE